MGVKLHDLVVREKIDFSRLEKKIVAIDAPNVILQTMGYVRKDGSQLMVDRTQRAISHLYGLMYRVNFYYSKKVFPIFCFDGRDSELKRLVTKDLLNDFRFAKTRYEDAVRKKDWELACQIATNKEFLWPNILLESKRLLGLLGVPCVDSPASAEAQCAHMVKNKIAHYSNSQDFDSLVFGCPRLVQNLSKSLKKKERGKWSHVKIEPTVIDLNDTLRKLEIDQFQLVDLVILIGSDYFVGIKSLGPKKALNLLKKHGDVENIIDNENYNYDFQLVTKRLIKNIRKIFLFPEVLNLVEDLCWNKPTEFEAIDLMCRDHHLNEERVKTNLKSLAKNYDACKSFFKGGKSMRQIALDDFA